MVDEARSLDVEGSMAERHWSTNEFQHVLARHSDNVSHLRTQERLCKHLVFRLFSDQTHTWFAIR